VPATIGPAGLPRGLQRAVGRIGDLQRPVHADRDGHAGHEAETTVEGEPQRGLELLRVDLEEIAEPPEVHTHDRDVRRVRQVHQTKKGPVSAQADRQVRSAQVQRAHLDDVAVLVDQLGPGDDEQSAMVSFAPKPRCGLLGELRGLGPGRVGQDDHAAHGVSPGAWAA